ncbi:hypothetical protein JMA_33770 [Jeotgalibacillus malaysiensis]|uniref:asparagine synthase (glutamine-hydrolyzing) n=1 Tax=Jeotgalibacillus malaysiensis TaxID=1508404 RepID=A0A0B5AXE6_9BACL|nr:asparagine synthase-related protein [Jeotgalibacillus malaysiensis]AJD92694.1 hypothetical protein JMA_33770 [Jeotgalibacillus malaysiensis]
MSALVGILSINKKHVLLEEGHRMMQAFEDFPADDKQIYLKNYVLLGNHAQWITPESVGEIQPFYCRESGCVISADAIIDNRQELFSLLNIPEYQRANMPDSQLILKAYLKWEEKAFNHLIGDFSFVIWDPEKSQLLGARDFSGLRTLYYSIVNEKFYMASTIKAIQNVIPNGKELDEEWLAEFMGVPGYAPGVSVDLTPFKQVKQLPPAHYFFIKNGVYQQHRYITLPEDEKIRFETDEEYVQAFKTIFERAVQDRLRTVGKVGSFLSGGLDSGSVTSIAAKQLSKEEEFLHSFSSIPLKGFSDWTPKSRIANEEEYIEEILKSHKNIIHHYESFPDKSSYKDIEQWLNIMETPYKFFENSYWIRGINERASQEGVNVLLSGSRGNFTVSWGNAFDHFVKRLTKMKIRTLINEVQEYHLITGHGRKDILKKTLKKLKGDSKKGERLTTLLNEKYFRKYNLHSKMQQTSLITHWDQTIDYSKWRNKYFNELFPLLNYNASSKLSLKYKVWTRDPTNDLRVVRFCLSIPEEQFFKSGMDRALIRLSTKKVLPEKVRLNHQVRGLQSADLNYRLLDDWHKLKKEVNLALENNEIASMLDIEKAKMLLNQLGDTPDKALAVDYNFKVLMNLIVFTRFLSRLKGGESYEEKMDNDFVRIY